MTHLSTELRRRNRVNLLRHLHLNGPATRAALTTDLGLNRSTIKTLVDELTSNGLVTERLPADRDGPGRPSPLVIPRSDAMMVMSVDIRVDDVAIGLMGIDGRLHTRQRWNLRGDRSARRVLGDIAGVARSLIQQTPRPIHGVGVAVPGIVRCDDGFVHEAPNLSWHDIALREWFEGELRLPADVGNDAELGAIAENMRGAGQGAHDMAYIFADVGIGGGVISRGVSLLGTRSHVGEFGHMVVHTDGKACYCGCRGCWETEIGRAALSRALHLPASSGREVVVTALREIAKDPDATERQLGDIAKWLAAGLCDLVNVLGSDLVVLGGLLAEMPDANVERTQEIVQRRSIVSRSVRGARIVKASLGSDAPLVGAAEIAIQRALSALGHGRN